MKKYNEVAQTDIPEDISISNPLSPLITLRGSNSFQEEIRAVALPRKRRQDDDDDLPDRDDPPPPPPPAAKLSVQVSDFERKRLLIQLDCLVCDFCSSSQRFACSFLQIPPREWTPLPSG